MTESPSTKRPLNFWDFWTPSLAPHCRHFEPIYSNKIDGTSPYCVPPSPLCWRHLRIAPYLCDTEDDEDVTEGGEDREEDEGESPVVGRQSPCCGIEAGRKRIKKKMLDCPNKNSPVYVQWCMKQRG